MGAPQKAGPAFLAGSGGVQLYNQQAGTQTFTANGAIYQVQIKVGSGGPNVNGTGVYKSTDGGNTWTEMDSANAPNSAAAGVTLDSANNRLLFGCVTITSPQTPQAIFLKPFNFASDTWGANFATGGPLAQTTVQSVFLRSTDTTTWVIYDFGPTNPATTSRLRAAFWNGTTWSSSIDVGVNMIPSQADGNIGVTQVCAAIDSTGTIHVAYNNGASTLFFYQQIFTDNTLKNFHQFTGLNLSGSAFGSLIISGVNVLISFASNTFTNNALLVGTPLASPSWSTVTPASLTQPSGQVNFAGPLATDGTNLIWLINSLDPTLTYVFYQIARSTDGGKTWSILNDNQTANYFYNFAPGGSAQAPHTDATFGAPANSAAILNIGGTATVFGFSDVHNTVSAAFAGYFLNSEALGASPVTPTKLEISLFGVKRWPKEPQTPCVEMPERTPLKRVM